VLSHGEVVLHDRADALRADRQLLVASYLGEQAKAMPSEAQVSGSSGSGP
jgi:hypothetical protein